jgi:hypothetical protein
MSPTTEHSKQQKLKIHDKKIMKQKEQLPMPSAINEIKPAQQQKQLKQQHILHQKYISENLPFGNDITSDDHFEGFLFHNVNGLKDEHNWFQIL